MSGDANSDQADPDARSTPQRPSVAPLASGVYEFAAEIARLAMEADPSDISGLIGVLRRCREYFDVESLSVWRAAERGRYKNVAAIFADQSSHVTPVEIRVEDDFQHDLTRRGHFFIDGSELGREFETNLREAGQILIVPIGGEATFTGVVAFRSPHNRRWTDEEIAAAESVPQLIFHLVTRLRLEQETARQKVLLDLVDQVRAISVGTTFDTKLEVEGRVLGAIRDSLGADSVSICGVTEPPVIDHLVVEILARDGHVFTGAEGQQLDRQLPYADEDVRLLVANSGVESDVIVLSVERSDGRRWTRNEVSAVRSVVGIIRETELRIKAEHELLRRMVLEALAAKIAADLVDVSTDNIDMKLDNTLSAVVRHFGLDEASIWRFDGDQARCRKSRSAAGAGRREGLTTSRRDTFKLESRGWEIVDIPASTEVVGLDDGAHPDRKALLTSYGGPNGVLGTLELIESERAEWRDDEIGTVRMIADMIGQVCVRVLEARSRDRRNAADEILADMSRRLLEVNFLGSHAAIEPSVEALRVHLGLESLAVWEIKTGGNELGCPCVATISGGSNISELAPINMTNPVIEKLRSSDGPVTWDMDGDAPGLAGRELAALPIYMVEDDFVFLTALPNDPSPVTPEITAALRTACGILAQARRRFNAERLTDLRRQADRVMNRILLRFVDTGVGDEMNPLPDATADVGELLGAASLELWEIDEDGATARRSEVWSSETTLDLPGDAMPLASLRHPDAMVLSELTKAGIIQLEGSTPAKTLIGAPLKLGSKVVGGLVLDVDRDHIPEPELEVIETVLDSFAALILQLRTRIAAESTVVRRLAFDERLEELATGLLRSTAADTTTTDEAFKALCRVAEIDQATLCRANRTAAGIEILLVNHSGTNGVGSLPDRYTEVIYAPEAIIDLSEDGQILGQWPLSSAPEPLRRPLSEIAPPGDRTVIALGRSVGETSAMCLFVSRPGHRLFDRAEVEYLKSALSMLAEHDARITAEAWFSAAIGHSPIAISMRDVHMNLITCNSAYERLTGCTFEELQDTDLHDVLTKPDAIELTARQEGQPDEDHVTLEIRYQRPDGSVVWGRLQSTAVSLPGRRDPYRLTYVEDITNSRRHRDLLEWQATHDDLTGLPNRRRFIAQAKQRLEQNRDDAMIVLDLDRFKVVNDSLGHSVGDQLLVVCADRIRLSLRPGDLLCRLGGDEFAILLTTPADMATASAVADRLLSLLREPTEIGGVEVFASASIGIAMPRPEDSIDDLLRHADSAMYQSKSAGRDRWTGFDSSMREAVLDRVRTETDLRLAIDNGQLEVHYQPEIVMSSGAVVGAEALVRWRHPVLGLLSAGAFINVAEESGIVIDLGRWVLGVATHQAAEWIAQGHDIIIRVNLSARQLRPAVVTEVEDALGAAGLPPERLCLELTETAIMDDVEESEAVLAQLHNLGVKLAIDDFGTGFSSLAYLKRLPVDILKIDQSFVAGVGVDSDDTAIVESVIALARTLSLDVVAEGIENATQQRELLRLGCERGQGFHLARPAPAADVEALLESSRQI